MTKNQKFEVLALQNNRIKAFGVVSEKAEEFKSQTNSKEDNEQVAQMAESFRINNLGEPGPRLVKK